MNSVISTSARSSGRTQVAWRVYSRGGVGVNGQSAVRRSSNRRPHHFQRALAETGTDASGEHEVVTRRTADQDRSERGVPVAAAGREPADHDLDLNPVLDLAPVRRAATRLVDAAEPLGHDTFELLRSGGGDQRGAVADVVGGHDPVPAGCDHLGEQSPPLLVRQRDRVAAVDLEDVEHEVDGLALVALDQLEPWPAEVVEHRQLAVEDRARRIDARRQSADLRPAAADVSERGRLQTGPVAVDEGERAVAVVLDLERPLVVIGRQRAEHALHRHDGERQRHSGPERSQVEPGDVADDDRRR